MNRAHARAEAGFTLPEMLVSLALLALIAVLVAQAARTQATALGRIERHASHGDEVSLAEEAIRDRIEHALFRATFVGAIPRLEFAGAPDRLELVALSNNAGEMGAQRYRIDLDRSGELRIAAAAPDGPADYGAPVVLARRVQAVAFAYYGRSAALGGAPGWSDQWRDESTPPQLVRMRVRFGASDAEQWPEMIARPAATIDDACMIDPGSGGCRGRS